ncbi:VOC family protein [Nocardia aurantiaca]|uniref:Glyoxalase/bleomycin resistance/extradiol dioxygenase family protein n=1 Tax=Nocardia aurantiaca TaxID=2675850 RepID=A0A6I3KSU0_9NOCA|nr:VOC family protein [Nocardia aurantiaca]MTE11224.1 glyoxalase/bleomycin resistance/extradiol dioxygenase family protein [Nocardia aurantiaca]
MPSKMIFINLPVADLDRSKRFYEAIGWKVNQDFTDGNAACIMIDDNICVMLLTRDFFTTFSTRPLGDIRGTVCGLYALALTGPEEVDDLTEAAIRAGGIEEVHAERRTQEAEVGMYGRTFLDPDGHQWEPFHMAYPGR